MLQTFATPILSSSPREIRAEVDSAPRPVFPSNFSAKIIHVSYTIDLKSTDYKRSQTQDSLSGILYEIKHCMKLGTA